MLSLKYTDITAYNALHKYHLRIWTKTGTCEHCGEKRKTQWANISGEYRRGDKTDWWELCGYCHRAYDLQTCMSGKRRGTIPRVRNSLIFIALTHKLENVS